MQNIYYLHWDEPKAVNLIWRVWTWTVKSGLLKCDFIFKLFNTEMVMGLACPRFFFFFFSPLLHANIWFYRGWDYQGLKCYQALAFCHCRGGPAGLLATELWAERASLIQPRACTHSSSSLPQKVWMIRFSCLALHFPQCTQEEKEQISCLLSHLCEGGETDSAVQTLSYIIDNLSIDEHW